MSSYYSLNQLINSCCYVTRQSLLQMVHFLKTCLGLKMRWHEKGQIWGVPNPPPSHQPQCSPPPPPTLLLTYPSTHCDFHTNQPSSPPTMSTQHITVKYPIVTKQRETFGHSNKNTFRWLNIYNTRRFWGQVHSIIVGRFNCLIYNFLQPPLPPLPLQLLNQSSVNPSEFITNLN